MAKAIRVETNTKDLEKAIKAIVGANSLAVKVGILSKKNARTGAVAESNASIGMIHEFGSYSRNIPERSFIKMPLTMKSGELVKKIKRLIQENIAEGSVRPLLKKIGAAAEGIIGQAFASDGFGTWELISDATARRKKSAAILIETSQLQRSITSAVVDRGK